ncbi:transposase [Gallibacterium anatis]
MNRLREKGYIIQSITCDGRRGLLKDLFNTPTQMCQFHLVAICSGTPILQSSIGGKLSQKEDIKMRRTFSPDYKVAAVKLVTEQGYSVAQACSELGIGETALRRWIKQVQAEKQGYVLPGTKPLSPEQQRIQELEQRIKILEEDKEILKKATAIFMSLERNATKR